MAHQTFRDTDSATMMALPDSVWKLIPMAARTATAMAHKTSSDTDSATTTVFQTVSKATAPAVRIRIVTEPARLSEKLIRITTAFRIVSKATQPVAPDTDSDGTLISRIPTAITTVFRIVLKQIVLVARTVIPMARLTSEILIQTMTVSRIV